MGICSQIYEEELAKNVASKKQQTLPDKYTYKRGSSLLNPVRDASHGVRAGLNKLPEAGAEMVKGAGNVLVNASKGPIGGFSNAAAAGRGLIIGSADLAPSTVGLVVDLINSVADNQVINMPEERRRPMGYAFDKWRELQDQSKLLAQPVLKTPTETIPNYIQQPKIKQPNSFTEFLSGNTEEGKRAALIEGLAQFAVPGAVAAKTAGKISNISKLANTSKKISNASKTASASNGMNPNLYNSASKYKKQMERMVADEAKEQLEAHIKPSFGKELANNTAFGFGLGALEGNNLEERFANAAVGGGLGIAGSLMHGGARKLSNTELAKNTGENFKKYVNNLTKDSETASKIVAGVDSALGTKISSNASEMTRLRKEAYDRLNNSRRHTDNELEQLEKASNLSKEAEQQAYEINKYGEREAAFRRAKKLKEEQAKNNTENTVNDELKKQDSYKKSQEEEAEDFFNSLLKEEYSDLIGDENIKQKSANNTSDLTKVKSEADINTPNDTKTGQNDTLTRPTIKENKPIKSSGIIKPNEHTKPKLKDNQYIDENGNVITRLEPGIAEGAEGSSNFYKKNSNKKENIYNDINNEYSGEENGAYDGYSEKSINEIEQSIPERRYVTEDADFIDWYSRYSKASKRKKNLMLKQKIEKFSNKKDLDNFSKIFSEQERIDRDIARQRSIGDKSVDTADVSETKRLSEAIDKYGVKREESVSSTTADGVWKEKFKKLGKKTATAKFNAAKTPEALQKTYNSFKEKINRLKTTQEIKNQMVKDLGESFVSYLAKKYNVLSKETILNNEHLLKDIDAEYIKNNKRYTVSELPSKIFKKVKEIDAFDNAKQDLSNINVGEISNKLYLKYGSNNILKQYAKDYPNSKINIIDSSNKEYAGRTFAGAFIPETFDIIIHKDNIAKGNHSVNYVIAHECRHAQQYKNPKNKKAFEQLEKITNDFEEYKNDNKDILESIQEAADKGIIKIKNNKTLLPSKATLKHIQQHLGENATEVYNTFRKKYAEYRKHPLERDASDIAKGIENGQFTELPTIRRTYLRHTGSGYNRSGRTENKAGSPEYETEGRTQEAKQKEKQEWAIESDDGSLNDKTFSNRYTKMLDWFDKTSDKSAELYRKIKNSIAPDVKDITGVFRTLNDERESFFKEFGTYTSERMKNRLLQQSESGEGVYFKQIGNADKKVHFGVETKDKVGFTGVKELNGLARKGSTKQSLLAGFEDRIRRENTRNVINFYKEHFNKPGEGLIPVNSKLLANTMYFGKSKAFYETIRKGKDAIDAVFDKENAKQWKELYDTTDASNSDIYLPKDLFDFSIKGDKEYALDYLKTYGKEPFSRNWVKGVGKATGAIMDLFTDRFKRMVLTSMSFFTNNRFGNQIMLAMSADNPVQYLKGIADAFKLKDSELPSEILESTLAESITQEANGNLRKYFSEKNNTYDNLARILDGNAIDTSNLHGVGKTAAVASNWLVSKPNSLFKKISEEAGRINERFERFERKQAFSQNIHKIQKEGILKTANKLNAIHELAKEVKDNKLLRQTIIDKTADVLGDYNNFSKFEKNVLKRIVPFYAWNRTILRHIVSIARENPVKMGLIAYETWRLLNQDDGLEDYKHGSLKVNSKNKRTNSNIIVNKGKYIPYNTPFEMLSSDNIGSVNPLFTKPIEAIIGEKFFKGSKEISSKKYKKMSYKGKKGYLNAKTGEFKEGGLPVGARLGYVGKNIYETVYPMAGSPMTKGIVDAVKHYKNTGEFLFPDKYYDADLGGYYHGDYIGTSKTGKQYAKKYRSAKNRLDLKYQLMNRLAGTGIQPEKDNTESKTDKYKRQSKRMNNRY